MQKSVVWISLFLLLHITGCTAYRPAEIPGNYSPAETQEQENRELLVGDSVRVTLIEGDILTGNIKNISSQEIIIGKTGNFGYEEIAVSLPDISTVEVEGVAGPLGLLRGSALIAGVLVGTVFVLIMALGASPSGN